MNLIYAILIVILFVGCQQAEKPVQKASKVSPKMDQPPEWAKTVVWYEIAVERFRNGDPSNDPTADDIKGAYPGFVPEGWAVTPWTHDWYKPNAYFSNFENRTDYYGNSIEKFVDKVQTRRYGGDLQGVLDKINYMDSLGITAIYFRPLNDSPSLHKYDARHWRHIDVNFGPNPTKDKAIIASEIPDDPSTWKMTTADELFLKVINVCHEKGIKVVLDYSWNHTGQTFWAWQDVVKHQEQSKYKDWYWVDRFDDPETHENEFKFHGWAGVPDLPELKETQKQDLSKSLTAFEGNMYSEAAKQHIFNVAKRWLDPNGDGDPSDGVDGYRLDVTAEVPLGFWREFRTTVRQINPEAYLLGEIWWEDWPDKLLDPEPFLKGDVFDAVMNYRWYRAVRHFFNESPNSIPVSTLVDSLNSFKSTIRRGNNYAMMNYTGGYDTPRLLTSLFNKTKYKYGCKVHENPDYKIHKPDAATFETLKLLLVKQYTYFGSPHIYAGDEMGMWGADDPSSRKPLIWPDFSFEDETTHPLGTKRPRDKVTFNHDLFGFHQQLIRIRKSNPLLVHAEIEFITLGNSEDLLAYRRYDKKDEVLVVFNHHSSAKNIKIPRAFKKNYTSLLQPAELQCDGNTITIEIPARTAMLLKPVD